MGVKGPFFPAPSAKVLILLDSGTPLDRTNLSNQSAELLKPHSHFLAGNSKAISV
jgi:hypothetical protein